MNTNTLRSNVPRGESSFFKELYARKTISRTPTLSNFSQAQFDTRYHGCIIFSYKLVIIHMSTISVPLPVPLLRQLDRLTKETGASRAAVMRKALERYAEEQAINTVILAEREPTLHGDLDNLLAKLG